MITFPRLGDCGRLGNQLWQFASTLGIAAARNEEASFPPWDYQPFFSAPAELFSNQPGTPADEFVPYMDERTRIYLQDYALWKDIAPVVKDYLQPSNEALAKLQEYPDFWALEPPVCSLHVRRGDNAYENPPGYHPLRAPSYYFSALDALEYESVVCFSDDIPWCRETFGDKVDLYFEGLARPKEHTPEWRTAPVLDWIDLHLMTFCQSHIVPNSTYAWWGAFLSDDPSPIYPDNWFGPLLRYVDASLMFPPHWRKFPCEVEDP